MNAPDRAAATLGRLLAVDWTGEAAFDHPRSRARLTKEYLRRAAWWARELDAEAAWPFLDVAERLAPGVHAPEDLAGRLDELITLSVGWPSVATVCRAALRWSAVLDAGVPVPALDDPYEPLLLVFERGGGFTTEHGFVDLGGASVRIGSQADHLTTDPVVSLASADLDALDPVG